MTDASPRTKRAPDTAPRVPVSQPMSNPAGESNKGVGSIWEKAVEEAQPIINIIKSYLALLGGTFIPFCMFQKFFKQGDNVIQNFTLYLTANVVILGVQEMIKLMSSAAITSARGLEQVASIYNYVPISSLAIVLLRWLSSVMALYLVGIVVVNLEVLVLFPLVIKQRAYSYMYRELSTPMIGPVFMTQMKQFGILMLDGFLTPWTWIGGVVGHRLVPTLAR